MKKEEAIKILRGVHDNALFSVRSALETFIPELIDSEDERIRKELVDFVNYYRHNTDLTTEQAEWTKKAIAYLEKQKEQKPFSTEETELNSIAFLEQMGYTCVPPSEQKPAEENEEDDVMFKTAKKIIWESEASEGTANKVISWLKNRFKSLRTSWKPSEEQMDVLLNAEGLVRAYNYPENAKILASLYEQLKKL